ncbi:MAG TPA: transposase, partial [Ktedonobacteraceae bacterium]|nr:transposase [Ktedonobacteraceae bacterium]
MNLNTLQDFRHDVYGCFPQAAGALFNTVDALLCETQARSLPELSLSPFFERRWGSL